ncbi:4a-hydroxytetrahydrobiopterin dehydratase [Vibrio scophthalmi]|uniref:4a-hydroxytetrahydrobiopterin dehydratase n=1 Tax=Vibrio scophthalmi TaxID=45658 RepID=UPI002FF27326
MLNELRCEACHSDATPLGPEERRLLLTELEGWKIVDRDGIPQLEKEYRFKNYQLAWAFANKVSQLAEEEFHHPSLLLEWGKVTVTWWSHSIKGLHQNDFICAAKCDRF